MNDNTFETDICSKLDQILIKYEHMCIVGDLNYNLLVSEKSHTLRNIIDTYSLKNLIQDPTCHTKIIQPSLIDVFLTNSPSFLCNTINFDCGLSDCHNMTAACFKESCISNKRQQVTFRSYKNFQEAEFTQDLHLVGSLLIDIGLMRHYWWISWMSTLLKSKNSPKKNLHLLWTQS